MSPQLTTFLFELVNFLILAGVLGWFFFKPISEALVARRNAQEEHLKEVETKLSEAEATKAEIAKRHSELEQEGDRIREKARASAREEAESILAEAHKQADREREQTLKELSGLSDAELTRLASASAAAAAVVLEKLLGRIQAPPLQEHLVDTASRELVRLASEPLHKLLVESAMPLDEASKAKLNSSAKDSGSLTKYQVNPEIGFGLRIETDRGVIDLTASGFSSHARRELASRIVERAQGVETP